MNAVFLAAAVVIVLIIAVVAMYTIKRLAGHPVRIAAVLVALSGLLSATAPLLHELHNDAPSVITAPASPPPFAVASGGGR